MLSIGDFARITRTSVRMLRHYDALGLVVPERVDDATGYRWYRASQAGRVNRLLALRDLGFSLAECGTILDDVTVGQLQDMLQSRRAELAERIDADTARLAEVARRLRSIENGMTMTTNTLTLTTLPALRLAGLSGVVNDETEIGLGLAPLLEDVAARLAEAGIEAASPVRTYFGRLDEPKIDVAVGIPRELGAPEISGLEILELPEETRAATVILDAGADIADGWLAFGTAVERAGLYEYGVCRQLQHPDGTVELQRPVRDLADGRS